MPSIQDRLLKAADKAFLTRATVSAVRELGEKFRLIELEGPELRGVKWKPGDKIQVRVAALAMRTYTPVVWDAMNGRMSVLAYLHGNGPGSEWAAAMKTGMSCAFWGPSRAVNVPATDGPIVLFGDETSIGTAAALRGARAGRDDRFIFEVSSVDATRMVLESLGLPGAVLVEKGQERTENAVRAVAAADGEIGATRIWLTGRVKSMRRLSASLVMSGVSLFSLRSKPYWMEGIPGLD